MFKSRSVGFHKILRGSVYWAFSLFFFWHFKFSDLGGLSPQYPFQSFRSWGPPPKIRISGIRAGYDSMGMMVSCIFQSQFFCRKFFFWAATLQIRSETFGTKFIKTNTRSRFLSKNHPISKKKMGRIRVWMWEISLI